ncbi:hypothetical protein HS088_TW08G00230 [Tripterygium wilfordii]|uniref:Uncharacterized protein n=1 Tax=Tripterygium wilfordii TaxID=458696 RepID=A0A7J7DB90_TRIWF|nr:hypothetical protein HS088_TW08G00230 [Tripterygium wilfordii]
MAAFSANKKSKTSNHITQGHLMPPSHSGSPAPWFSLVVKGSANPEMTPPVHQVQQSYYSTDQRYLGCGHYSGFAPCGSPTGIGGPFATRQATPPRGWHEPRSIANYGLASNLIVCIATPDSGPVGSPSVYHGRSGKRCWVYILVA